MKLISDYKFRFYTSRMNEFCLHCHWLRLLMKGIFDSYVLWPFDKKFIFELVTRVNTPDYTVHSRFEFQAGHSNQNTTLTHWWMIDLKFVLIYLKNKLLTEVTKSGHNNVYKKNKIKKMWSSKPEICTCWWQAGWWIPA